MNKIVVTGSAGFIGSALVEQLLKIGEHVIGVDFYTRADIQRAKKILNWQPQVDFATGIQCFIAWLRGAQ